MWIQSTYRYTELIRSLNNQPWDYMHPENKQAILWLLQVHDRTGIQPRAFGSIDPKLLKNLSYIAVVHVTIAEQ